MAAAATADPTFRATRRARAACNWAAKLFLIEDHVDAARYSAGGERCTVELFGICEEVPGDVQIFTPQEQWDADMDAEADAAEQSDGSM